MTNLNQAMQVISLRAYGTSEGVEKAWDTRGRGAKVLKKLGYRPIEKDPSVPYDRDVNIYRTPRHDLAVNTKSGHWSHYDNTTGKGKEGVGFNSLEEHLRRVHGEAK